jgi:hypothetical protein
MASTNEIHPENFNNDNSFKVDTLSALLSSVETKANTGLILVISMTQILKQVSLIHKHTRIVIKEEKAHTKKCYFCKYYPPKDLKRHHSSTIGL